LNAENPKVPRSDMPSKSMSNSSLRLMKWLVLIVLLLLILLALFLPDRGLAVRSFSLTEGVRHTGNISVT
jgi:uncharacterized integral membrane protein